MTDLSGTSFQAKDVAQLYIHRPPYATQLYTCLAENAPKTGRLLDLGCGEGKIARPMSQVFDQVVAVDPSDNMIALGRSLDHGRATNLDWLTATAEDVDLDRTFDLVTFASSIHWMDPVRLFPKLQKHLSADYLLAIVDGDAAYQPAWQSEYQTFLEKWVLLASGREFGSQEWQDTRDRHIPHVDVLETFEFISEPFRQSVDAYVMCHHSRDTFTRENLGEHIVAFRNELRELLEPHADSQGHLAFHVKTNVTLAKLTAY